MTFVRAERDALTRTLLQAGADAPTLCEGWTTHDLAAHLWIRENDAVGATGIVSGAFAGLTERRMAETKQRRSYRDLVGRLAAGPTRWSVFAIPGMDDQANAVEYFVHHEDVRRAGTAPAEPRALDAEVEESLWRRLRLMSRALFRRSPVGIVLERSDVPGAEQIRAMPGNPTVTLVGPPSELMLYAHGRLAVARVRAIGDEAALAQIADTDLSV